jgi:hypothetical protein
VERRKIDGQTILDQRGSEGRSTDTGKCFLNPPWRKCDKGDQSFREGAR